MSDEEKDEGTAKSAGILEFFTSKIKEITTLLVAVVALLAVIQQIRSGGNGESDGGASKTPGSLLSGAGLARSLRECLDAELDYPRGTVAFSEWADMNFHLTGENGCDRELTVHVAFRSMEPDIPLQPLPGCNGDLANLDCWAGKTFSSGTLDWRFSPPALNPLRDLAVGDTTNVQIKWVIYAEGGVRLRTNTVEIPLRYDLT